MLGYGVILVVLIVWANRRQQQIQVEDGTFAEASALRALAMRPPGRAAISGSLGGSIFGGTTWLVVVAICAGDWLGSGIVALLAVATFFREHKRMPAPAATYWSIAAIVCAGIGLGTLALINLRWSVWFGNYPQLKGGLHLVSADWF